jgi:hypothetical protein
MRKTFLKLFTSLSVLFVILVLADVGNAQKRRESRNRKMSKTQVEQVIKRLEQRVDNFDDHFDRSLDNSRLNGTEREDWLNKRASDLESATDELRREFDKRDTWAENKDEVRRCLDIATDIDKNVRSRKYSKDTENIWARVRYELNTLADIYNLPKVGSSAY